MACRGKEEDLDYLEMTMTESKKLGKIEKETRDIRSTSRVSRLMKKGLPFSI